MRQPFYIASNGKWIETNVPYFYGHQRVLIDLYNRGLISWRTIRKAIFNPTD